MFKFYKKVEGNNSWRFLNFVSINSIAMAPLLQDSFIMLKFIRQLDFEQQGETMKL